MLVRTDQLSVDDLKRCQAAFDALDADGSGTLGTAHMSFCCISPHLTPRVTPSGTLDMADIEAHKRREAAERNRT